MNSFLFVCYANICRSPCLEGILNYLLTSNHLDGYADSCGIPSCTGGNSPHPTIQALAYKYDISLTGVSKPFQDVYFDQFDYIFCVSHEIKTIIQSLSSSLKESNKVMIATHYSIKYHKNSDIINPVFLNTKVTKDLTIMWDVMYDACKGIVRHYYQ